MHPDIETLLDRAREDNAPSDIDVITDRNLLSHVRISYDSLNDISIPLNEFEKVTGKPDELRDFSLLLSVRSKDGMVIPETISLRLITAFHTTMGDIVNADYYLMTEDYINQTSHNHAHLVTEPDNSADHYLLW